MDGLLLAETTDAGSLIRVYFWAEDAPIAQMDTELTYLHADHLDTPRIGTNSSGTIVWQWNSDAFGSLLPNEDPDGNGTPTTVNLRFPGQYFDKETGLHYNYFRDYDPKIGRYLESDPIGLMGGLNTFGYVGQNPLNYVDPTGENPLLLWALGGVLTIGDMLIPSQPNPKYPDAIESVKTIPGPFGPFRNIKKQCEAAGEIARDVRKSLGNNPFKGKTSAQIERMFRDKGFEPKGPAPLKGQGTYINPRTGRGYHIDGNHPAPKGPHVGVHRPRGSSRNILNSRDYPLE